MGVTETGVAEMFRAARMVRVAEKTEAAERIEVATAVGAGEVFDRAVWVAESVRKIVVRLALGGGRSDVGSAGAGLGLAVVIAVAAGRLEWRAPVDAPLIEPRCPLFPPPATVLGFPLQTSLRAISPQF